MLDFARDPVRTCCMDCYFQSDDIKWPNFLQLVCRGEKIHLGTFKNPRDAARAWDIAAIEHRGHGTVTNFDIGEYRGECALCLKFIFITYQRSCIGSFC